MQEEEDNEKEYLALFAYVTTSYILLLLLTIWKERKAMGKKTRLYLSMSLPLIPKTCKDTINTKHQRKFIFSGRTIYPNKSKNLRKVNYNLLKISTVIQNKKVMSLEEKKGRGYWHQQCLPTTQKSRPFPNIAPSFIMNLIVEASILA